MAIFSCNEGIYKTCSILQQTCMQNYYLLLKELLKYTYVFIRQLDYIVIAIIQKVERAKNKLSIYKAKYLLVMKNKEKETSVIVL